MFFPDFPIKKPSSELGSPISGNFTEIVNGGIEMVLPYAIGGRRPRLVDETAESSENGESRGFDQ